MSHPGTPAASRTDRVQLASYIAELSAEMETLARMARMDGLAACLRGTTLEALRISSVLGSAKDRPEPSATSGEENVRPGR